MIEPSVAYAHHVNWMLPNHPIRRRVLHVLPLRFLAPDCWLIGGLTTEQAAVYYQHLVRSAKGQDGVANVLSAQGTCLGSEVKPISLAVPKDRALSKRQTPADLFRDALRDRFRHALLGPCRGVTWAWRKKNGLTPEQYREKWGYPRNMPLVCKALQRERRKKMKDMKLWEKRIKNKNE